MMSFNLSTYPRNGNFIVQSSDPTGMGSTYRSACEHIYKDVTIAMALGVYPVIVSDGPAAAAANATDGTKATPDTRGAPSNVAHFQVGQTLYRVMKIGKGAIATILPGVFLFLTTDPIQGKTGLAFKGHNNVYYDYGLEEAAAVKAWATWARDLKRGDQFAVALMAIYGLHSKTDGVVNDRSPITIDKSGKLVAGRAGLLEACQAPSVVVDFNKTVAPLLCA